MQSNISSEGRTLEQSPRRSLCSKCGQFMDSQIKIHAMSFETPKVCSSGREIVR